MMWQTDRYTDTGDVKNVSKSKKFWQWRIQNDGFCPIVSLLQKFKTPFAVTQLLKKKKIYFVQSLASLFSTLHIRFCIR